MPTFREAYTKEELRARNAAAWYETMNVNDRKHGGRGASPAFLAVKQNSLEMLKLLTTFGADLSPWFTI